MVNLVGTCIFYYATYGAWFFLSEVIVSCFTYLYLVTRPLVGKSKADYDVMPEANNDTAACIQTTLLASLKDAIPNACVFKGILNLKFYYMYNYFMHLNS